MSKQIKMQIISSDRISVDIEMGAACYCLKVMTLKDLYVVLVECHLCYSAATLHLSKSYMWRALSGHIHGRLAGLRACVNYS